MKFEKIKVLEYKFYVAKNGSGIIYIDTENKFESCFRGQFNFKDLEVETISETRTGKNKDDVFLTVQRQLEEYFLGKRKTFDFKYDLIGSAFSKEVWQELKDVPYGTTISYRELAKRLGDVKKTRAVANAAGKNPLLIVIPCHRVIGSNGGLRGFRAGLDMKKSLLEVEGVNYL